MKKEKVVWSKMKLEELSNLIKQELKRNGETRKIEIFWVSPTLANICYDRSDEAEDFALVNWKRRTVTVIQYHLGTTTLLLNF